MKIRKLGQNLGESTCRSNHFPVCQFNPPASQSPNETLGDARDRNSTSIKQGQGAEEESRTKSRSTTEINIRTRTARKSIIRTEHSDATASYQKRQFVHFIRRHGY